LGRLFRWTAIWLVIPRLIMSTGAWQGAWCSTSPYLWPSMTGGVQRGKSVGTVGSDRVVVLAAGGGRVGKKNKFRRGGTWADVGE